MGKTPDEIKKGLECCSISHDYCGTECPYNCYANGSAKLSLLKDALTYIQQLETRLAQVERERDAAADDLAVIKTCLTCADGSKNIDHDAVKCFRCNYKDEWRWRGVCDENTKER